MSESVRGPNQILRLQAVAADQRSVVVALPGVTVDGQLRARADREVADVVIGGGLASVADGRYTFGLRVYAFEAAQVIEQLIPLLSPDDLERVQHALVAAAIRDASMVAHERGPA